MTLDSPFAGVPEEASQTRSYSPAYTIYALVLLTSINLMNSIDRIFIGILNEPLRKELHLADWQLGLMTGFAFAVFLGALGLPIARFADRNSRPVVIVATLSIWSVFTALCGTARGFLQLCLFRMGVGFGEAGCSPPAQSLIADYFPKTRRATALAFWAMGIPLGSLIGFPLGGLVADSYGWRAAFVAAGAPGLVLAVVAALTLRETRSTLRADMAAAKAEQPSIRQALARLAKKRSFWFLALGAATCGFAGYGQLAFISSFFLRTHHRELAMAAANLGLGAVGLTGLLVGVILGACGAVSYLAGGWLADKLGVRSPRNMMIGPIIGSPLGFVVLIPLLFAKSVWFAMAMLVICHLLSGLWFGPVYATAQGVVPPNMRASSTAILLFVTQSIGLGFGPLTVGAVSDFVSTGLHLGSAEGVRWGLLCASSIVLLGALFFWLGSRTLDRDLTS